MKNQKEELKKNSCKHYLEQETRMRSVGPHSEVIMSCRLRKRNLALLGEPRLLVSIRSRVDVPCSFVCRDVCSIAVEGKCKYFLLLHNSSATLSPWEEAKFDDLTNYGKYKAGF